MEAGRNQGRGAMGPRFPTKQTKPYRAGQEDVGEDCQQDGHTRRGEVTNVALWLLSANWGRDGEKRMRMRSQQRPADPQGRGYSLAMLKIMAKAAKMPARPCPLMMGAV